MLIQPKWLFRSLYAVLGVLVLIVGGVLIAVATVDLRPLVERSISESLDRPVTIASLNIGWGRHIAIEARGVKVANAAWSSKPHMISVDRLSAIVDLPSLLKGVVRYEKLQLDDATIVLERGADGAKNWKFGAQNGKSADSKSASGLALVPKNRRQFPTLIDFTLNKGRILFRRAGKPDIDIVIARGTISSPADDTPVKLSIDGAYNGTPLRLTDTGLASFIALRDDSTPYPAAFDMVAEAISLHFQGAIQEPLDFDGVVGDLKVEARSVGAAMKVFGAEVGLTAPLQIAGTFRHQADNWRLERASGRLAANPFTGTLALDEGKSNEADRLHLGVEFTQLALGPLISSVAATPATAPSSVPATIVDGEVRARSLTWEKLQLGDVVLKGTTDPQGPKAGTLTFGFYGGRIDIRAKATAAREGEVVSVEASGADVDLARLTQLSGLEAGQIVGRVQAHLAVNLHIITLKNALLGSRGQVTLSITGGSIARGLVELASSDLHVLFGKSEGMMPIECFAISGTLADSTVNLGAIQMRTRNASFNGAGKIDLAAMNMDILIQPRTSGFLALDQRLRIVGPLAKPSISPFSGNAPAAPPAAICPG